LTNDTPPSFRCKVGHFVPAALFEAVAVVLAAAYRRRRKGSL